VGRSGVYLCSPPLMFYIYPHRTSPPTTTHLRVTLVVMKDAGDPVFGVCVGYGGGIMGATSAIPESSVHWVPWQPL
jgi:hypothetical protein